MAQTDNRKLVFEIIVIIISLLFVVLSSFLSFSNYFSTYGGVLPAVDPHFFCSQANNILSTGNLLEHSPDYVDRDNTYSPGYSFFISVLSATIDLIPKQVIYYLPLFSLPLTFLFIFLFIRTIEPDRTKQFLIFLFSTMIIFSSFLAFRNLTIGIPQTLYLILILSSLILIHKIKNDKQFIPFLVIVLAGLILSHYVSFILVLLYIAIFILYNFKDFRDKRLLFWVGLLILLSIAPLLKSGLLGIFNPEFSEEFDIPPFIFSKISVEKFISLPLIILSIVFSLYGIRRRKFIELNTFVLILLASLFLYYVPLLDVFSPYGKRAMIFIALFISISIPLNFLHSGINLNKISKLFMITLLVVFISISIYSYQDSSWVKYFEKNDELVVKDLELDNKIIAIFPYNLMIQCYLDAPTDQIIRINPVELTDFNLIDLFPNNYEQGTYFYYNENSYIVLRQSGLGVDKELFDELVDKWRKEEVYFSEGNVTIYKTK